jgi:hypothetical protein
MRPQQDRTGRLEVWLRRVALATIVGFLALGLANVFGQRASTRRDTGRAAALEVRSPGALRGGLVFQGSVRVEALEGLERPALLLDGGWTDGITMNSLTPEPSEERQAAGRLVLEYDAMPAGTVMVVRLQLQVNPTTLGRRSLGVSVLDGERTLVRVDRRVTIFP